MPHYDIPVAAATHTSRPTHRSALTCTALHRSGLCCVAWSRWRRSLCRILYNHPALDYAHVLTYAQAYPMSAAQQHLPAALLS